MRYEYYQLTAHEREAVDRIYDGLIRFDETVYVGYTTEAEWEHIWHVLFFDSPELFHISTFAHTNDTYYAYYRMDQNTYRQKCDAIHSTVEGLKRQLPSSGDDFQKELILYRYVTDNCEYLMDNDDDHTWYADACLYHGRAQCSGYARGIALLFRCCGLKTLITGSDTHAWNIVLVNGKWYNCDATWDDNGSTEIPMPSRSGDDLANQWMNMPDRLVSLDADHRASHDPYFPPPACDSVEDSYAYRVGGYIAPGTSDLAGAINSKVEQAKRDGKYSVLILVDDASVATDWDNIWDRLYEKYGLYDWLFYPPGATRCVYAIRNK